MSEYFPRVKNRQMLEHLVDVLNSLAAQDLKKIYGVHFPEDGYINSDAAI